MKTSSFFIGSIPLLMAFMFILPPISILTEASEVRGEVGGYFSASEIYSSSRKLTGGMDSGDPDNDGDIEVAFCDFNGNVALLEESATGDLQPLFIWQAEGPQGSNRTLFDLAIHDLDPDKPGEEIITSGDVGPEGEKGVFLISYDGTEWSSETIYNSPFKTFDIEIGDIDEAPGDEIILSSYMHEEDFEIRYLCRSGSSWIVKSIPTLETPKVVAVGDADPDIPGVEVWACVVGFESNETDTWFRSDLMEYHLEGSEWVGEIIYTLPTNVISNVKIGNLLNSNPGNEIIIADFAGWCRYLYHDGTEFQVEDIFNSETIAGTPYGLEGLAIGDINPEHPGDEAIVTGYYNKVTQVVEVDGELVPDMAWEKDVEDLRLELSGVEITDVKDDYPGNEVIISSLQGWIELLVYEQDGIILESPVNEYEIDIGSSRNVYMEITPQGFHSGPVTLGYEPVTGLSVQIPSGLEIQSRNTLEVPVNIEVLDTFGIPKEVTLSLTAVSGTYTSSFDLIIDVKEAGSSDVKFIIDPPVGYLYREGDSTHVSKFSLINADEYDFLQISTGDVEGLQIFPNTPISPGQEQEVTISVNGMPDAGTYTVPITASYNGLTVAQGSLLIEILSMADAFTSSLRKVKGEDNMYLATTEFDGQMDVDSIQMEILVGGQNIFFDQKDFSKGDNFTFKFSLSEDIQGDVEIKLTTLGGTEIKTQTFSDKEYVKNEDKDSPLLVYIAMVVIIILIIGMVLLFIFYKPSPEDKEGGELQDIGSPSRYKAGKGPLGPRKVPITGRMDQRESRDVFDDIDRRNKVKRGNVRRAPPRPKSMGPPPREVRRAPPRRR